jgi:VIT1/CCC1 family predicted Fe2+/Mn2+ transporter
MAVQGKTSSFARRPNKSRADSVPRALAEPTLLFRRYFINTLFDSTFVVLGILAATSAEPSPSVDFTLGTVFAACLAVGVSTGVSVYEAEHTEGTIRLRRLERAMLSPMGNTGLSRELRASRIAIAIVNFLAPIAVASITSIPLVLLRVGLLPSYSVAAAASGFAGVSIIFAAGYSLGKLTHRTPWFKALRMSVVALLTFGGLFLLQNVL